LTSTPIQKVSQDIRGRSLVLAEVMTLLGAEPPTETSWRRQTHAGRQFPGWMASTAPLDEGRNRPASRTAPLLLTAKQRASSIPGAPLPRWTKATHQPPGASAVSIEEGGSEVVRYTASAG
jgi:hypothetical protein